MNGPSTSDYDQVFTSIVSNLNDVESHSKSEVLEWRKVNEPKLTSLIKVRKADVIGLVYCETSREITIDCEAGVFTFGTDYLSAARLMTLFKRAMVSLIETSEGDLVGVPTVSIFRTLTLRAKVQLRWSKQCVQVTLDPLRIILY